MSKFVLGHVERFAFYSASGSQTVSCRKISTSAWESAVTSFGRAPGFGCMRTNGNSAASSPPSAPRNNLTFTAYETMIPKASRWSGDASLQMK